MAGEQDSDVAFNEEDVLQEQVGKKSARELEKADAIAHEEAKEQFQEDDGRKQEKGKAMPVG
jgi:hypothetical protein